MMTYFDAHCHLQDERVRNRVEAVVSVYQQLGVGRAVVNGTCEADWPLVAELADRYPVVKPSFGLHPWRVNEASSEWKDRLASFWDAYPKSGVGEIGFDRWIDGYDVDRQWEAFAWQLDAASERSLPVSIHCLRAWGILDEALRQRALPPQGFLLHSYGGSREMAQAFAKLGAYFSVSAYFARESKRGSWEVIRAMPRDRLLIETDAPDMLGPEATRDYCFDGADGGEIQHPGNIAGVYRFVAGLLGMEVAQLAEVVEGNFKRFFGG